MSDGQQGTNPQSAASGDPPTANAALSQQAPVAAPQPQNSGNYPPTSATIAKEIHWLEKLNIIGQLSLVVVGIIAASIYGCQLHTMNGQLDQMVESGKQTDRLLCLYGRQLEQMTRQTDNTKNLTIEAGKQASASGQIAGATSAQSKAAGQISDTSAKQLDVLKSQLEQAQRPWIKITDLKINQFGFTSDGRVQVGSTIFFQNVGNFPTLTIDVWEKVFLLKWKADSRNNISGNEEAQAIQKKACSGESSAPISRLKSSSIFPGEPGNYGASVATEMSGSQEFLLRGTVAPVLVGCVTYRFANSTTNHQTGFIYYIMGKNEKGDAFYPAYLKQIPLTDVSVKDISSFAPKN